MRGDDEGVEREFAMAALAGAPVCPDYGCAPWPPTYEGRLRVLVGQMDALQAVLWPLYEAHRAFVRLGGVRSPGDDVSRSWALPAGATLTIRAGFDLDVDIGEIGRGVVPEPDPLVCLASALCDAQQWGVTMTVFTEAAAWAIAQAADWNVPTLGLEEQAP